LLNRLHRFRSHCAPGHPVGLDELPQVWNVLKGDMAIIGPRPERPYSVERLTQSIPFYRIRHAVKPGSPAGRRCNIADSVQDAFVKLQHDFYYIKNQGPCLESESISGGNPKHEYRNPKQTVRLGAQVPKRLAKTECRNDRNRENAIVYFPFQILPRLNRRQ
jgi:hypothetical protein